MKIEKTFIVSLPERLVDRLIPMIDEVKRVGLDYTVFSAIKNIDGRLGLLQTMTALFTKCVKNDENCIFILEDDTVFLVDNPIEIIDKCLEQLPKDFDLCYLGCNLWQERVYKYSENLLQLEDAYSTHSIIYNNIGMKKVLKAIQENVNALPLDVLIREEIMDDKKCFCSFPNLTTQRDGYSDIQNKNVVYKKFLEERFTERTKHL